VFSQARRFISLVPLLLTSTKGASSSAAPSRGFRNSAASSPLKERRPRSNLSTRSCLLRTAHTPFHWARNRWPRSAHRGSRLCRRRVGANVGRALERTSILALKLHSRQSRPLRGLLGDRWKRHHPLDLILLSSSSRPVNPMRAAASQPQGDKAAMDLLQFDDLCRHRAPYSRHAHPVRCRLRRRSKRRP
jgi:hypothetical protein